MLLQRLFCRVFIGVKDYQQFMQDLRVILEPFGESSFEAAARKFVISLEE